MRDVRALSAARAAPRCIHEQPRCESAAAHVSLDGADMRVHAAHARNVHVVKSALIAHVRHGVLARGRSQPPGRTPGQRRRSTEAVLLHVRVDVLAAVAGVTYVITYVRHQGKFCRADNTDVRSVGAHASAVQADAGHRSTPAARPHVPAQRVQLLAAVPGFNCGPEALRGDLKAALQARASAEASLQWPCAWLHACACRGLL